MRRDWCGDGHRVYVVAGEELIEFPQGLHIRASGNGLAKPLLIPIADGYELSFGTCGEISNQVRTPVASTDHANSDHGEFPFANA
jgi:hypothetical protein